MNGCLIGGKRRQASQVKGSTSYKFKEARKSKINFGSTKTFNMAGQRKQYNLKKKACDVNQIPTV